ncbi:MAG TPA: MogA/MoaB family molybdenum cofactor biosynthesis protein [Syntrophorhabdaceae bacterium]|nr:MogA/MoaB family molybdenum cofactor biosynthesis protein [Syntrophorhabdaceae bacterium]HQE80860.1 MogA/MoaB family molybdenum cofactor biosynthesis protein [Syntrophorhabdaceae bacterium]HQH43149.1 MogA/MoaB family molybdenum cofactor biosynthesis protein [Syntrophorhabdaceae bacterium]HQK46277.1 MogA/MoaB family molybdenum cofactor biosynthesis protein [Syntrophorhabdaceae bacterium]HRR71533.1 MogA/MoaB family molybdenum cofactor biosynthesis protein [Syntrophorhabdaceae bacterium]
MRYTAAIITISDKGSRGEREDKSGPAIEKMLKDIYDVKKILIVPDEVDVISDTLKTLIDKEKIDLIVTTGGTGVGKRDVTPEATRMIIEKDLPGFAEVMRMESYKITPHGIISRGICGIRGESIIINLPGSPKAATECLSFIMAALPHAISKVKGDTSDCG